MGRLLALGLLALLLAACANRPPQPQWLVEQGLTEALLDTGEFTLWTARNRAATQADGQELLILIEGDGQPWIRERWVAADPTPTQPLLLEFLAQTSRPAIYVGRPCYYGQQIARLRHAASTDCDSSLWTSARYSEQVVRNMARAVEVVSTGYRRITLLGHSGGGTLAVLIASQIDPGRELRVLTWAANLDVAAWTRFHGYSPLVQSLDPAQQPPLPSRIQQLHVAGGRDRVVAAQWIEHFSRRQPNSRYRFEPEFEHRCCWSESGEELLALLDY